MREKLQRQYDSIRDTIKANIETIRRLIDQAAALQEIVSTLSDEFDQEKVAKLKEEITNINSSIEELIKNTNNLFALYDDFVDTVLKGK